MGFLCPLLPTWCNSVRNHIKLWVWLGFLLLMLSCPRVTASQKDHLNAALLDACIPNVDKSQSEISQSYTPPSPEVTAHELRYLLARGADPNCHTRRGWTPLMVVIDNYAGAEPIKVLLSHGANVNLRDDEGETALMKLYKDKLFGRADQQCAELLLRAGAKVNLRNRHGETALILGAADDDEPDAEKPADPFNGAWVEGTLLKHEARVNVRARNGQTALMRAVKGWFAGDAGFFVPCHNTTALLLRHGADPNIRDSKGMTALMIAAVAQDDVSARLLLAHGADPNLRNKQGRTALMLAVTAYSDYLPYYGTDQDDPSPVIRVLLRGKADVGLRDRRGYTALRLAEIKHNTKALALLSHRRKQRKPRHHKIADDHDPVRICLNSVALRS